MKNCLTATIAVGVICKNFNNYRFLTVPAVFKAVVTYACLFRLLSESLYAHCNNYQSLIMEFIITVMLYMRKANIVTFKTNFILIINTKTSNTKSVAITKLIIYCRTCVAVGNTPSNCNTPRFGNKFMLHASRIHDDVFDLIHFKATN